MYTRGRPIFRKSAIDHYMSSGEESTMPRFGSARTGIILWLLLGCFLVIGTLAWNAQIPIYINGSGVALGAESQAWPGHHEALAAIFLPAQQAQLLRAGLPVQVHTGSEQALLSGQIVKVEPGTTDPGAFCKQYAPASTCSRLTAGPSIAVLVALESSPAGAYAGSVLAAQVRVGSLRIVSLL